MKSAASSSIQQQPAAVVCETLKRAIEGRDAELAASLYADDAELTIVNRNYPPSKPLTRKSRKQVFELYKDVCSREMTHKITGTIVGEDGFALRESCLYPDGCRVLSQVIVELRDGKIARQYSVDCWDE
ncbi:MAG TPA: nuclear transport factor 2 family protein [Burkholderiales bacterium]|nr:nuclear transport factor 2 family protein [Burkholderiales bacterium]